MQKFTDRDKEVLEFIQTYKEARGISPSVREIGAAVYMSVPTVQRHLWKLCQLGYISMEPRKPRTIVIKIAV